MARKAQIDLAIVRAMETSLSKFAGCSNFSVPAGSCISKLRYSGLWPIAEQCQIKSISLIFKQISNMSELVAVPCANKLCACKKISIVNTLRNEMEDIIGIKGGLCLDCVKAHEKSRVEKECRFCVRKL